MSISFTIFISFFIISWIPHDGFVLQEMPKNELNKQDDEDSVEGDLTVDFEIEDDDYEMVNHEEVEMINKNLKQRFGDSLRNANKERKDSKQHCSGSRNFKDKRLKAKITDAETDNSNAPRPVATLPYSVGSNPRKREVAADSEADRIPCEQTERETDAPDFKCSNPNCSLEKSNFESGLKVLESIKEFLSCDNCSSENARGIGIRAIRCLLADYSQNRQPCDVFAVRLWNIVIIWLVVYLVIAIPLWCTKGWCCCCLYCKFFKPQETIQEAKNYLLLNPPGVLITKKGAIINYEPTEREKDCYEEFGHFIRTL